MSETSPKTSPKSSVKKGIRRLTVSERAQISALWKSGEMTYDQLAKKFKKSVSTIKNVLRESGAVKSELKHEVEKKVAAAVEQTILSEATIYANRIKETKEEHYKMATNIAKLIYAGVVKAKQEGRPLATIAGDMKALTLAAQGLKISREERYAVLGIDAKDAGDDRPLPDLVVQELSADDIKEMHKHNMVQADEYGDEDLSLGDEALVNEENDRVETDE